MQTQEFLARLESLLQFLIPQYRAEGKSYLTVSIGCTGGRHRSVALAEELGRRLTEKQRANVKITHRDVTKLDRPVGGLRFFISSRVNTPLSTHSSASVRSTSAPFSSADRSASSVEMSPSARSSVSIGPGWVAVVKSCSNRSGPVVGLLLRTWEGTFAGTSTPSSLAIRESGLSLSPMSSATFSTSKASSPLPSISMAASLSFWTGSGCVLPAPGAA